jgi:hypothetical protein
MLISSRIRIGRGQTMDHYLSPVLEEVRIEGLLFRIIVIEHFGIEGHDLFGALAQLHPFAIVEEVYVVGQGHIVGLEQWTLVFQCCPFATVFVFLFFPPLAEQRNTQIRSLIGLYDKSNWEDSYHFHTSSSSSFFLRFLGDSWVCGVSVAARLVPFVTGVDVGVRCSLLTGVRVSCLTSFFTPLFRLLVLFVLPLLLSNVFEAAVWLCDEALCNDDSVLTFFSC